jgi:hypothetical protein
MLVSLSRCDSLGLWLGEVYKGVSNKNPGIDSVRQLV